MLQSKKGPKTRKNKKKRRLVVKSRKTKKGAKALRAENEKLKNENAGMRSQVADARERFDSLHREVKARIDEVTESERTRLLREKQRYEKLAREAQESKNQFDRELESFKRFRAAYAGAFGKIRVQKIERTINEPKTCPQCEGYGGLYRDCPRCSGRGWI